MSHDFDRVQRKLEKSEEEEEDTEMPELERLEPGSPTEDATTATDRFPDQTAEEWVDSDLAYFVAPEYSDVEEQQCEVYCLPTWQLKLVPYLEVVWNTKVGRRREPGSPAILGESECFAKHRLWKFVLDWAAKGVVSASPESWVDAQGVSRPEELAGFLEFCAAGRKSLFPPYEYPDAVWRTMLRERRERASPEPVASGKLTLRDLHVRLAQSCFPPAQETESQLPSEDPFLSVVPEKRAVAVALDELVAKETEGAERASLFFPVAGVLDLAEFAGKLVLAGGAALSLAFDVPKNDWDLFFVGVEDVEEATALVAQAAAKFPKIDGFYATPHAWTYTFKLPGNAEGEGNQFKKQKVQFVFRGYRTIDEILLGFDVDCCAVAYDGDDVWFSERAALSLAHATNYVDFDRLSTTYEYRLNKYRRRGFAVRIPDFDPARVVPRGYAKVVQKLTGKDDDKKRRYSRLRFCEGTLQVLSTKRGNTWRRRCRWLDPGIVAAVSAAPNSISLSGLDVLLFLFYAAERFHSPSDYSVDSVETSRYDPVRGCYSVRGKHVVARKNFGRRGEEPGLLTTTCAQPDRATFRAALQDMGLWPIWSVRAPGEQVISSFHRVVLSDLGVWYGELLYDNPNPKKFADVRLHSAEPSGPGGRPRVKLV